MFEKIKKIWAEYKEKKTLQVFKPYIIYYLFGEINFNSRWKMLMWSIQMAAALLLLYFVMIAPDFKVGKECAEFQPLIQMVKQQEVVCMDRKQWELTAGGNFKFNFTQFWNTSSLNTSAIIS